jgi:hypothetical protein
MGERRGTRYVCSALLMQPSIRKQAVHNSFRCRLLARRSIQMQEGTAKALLDLRQHGNKL